jgi:hypothetical protein
MAAARTIITIEFTTTQPTPMTDAIPQCPAAVVTAVLGPAVPATRPRRVALIAISTARSRPIVTTLLLPGLHFDEKVAHLTSVNIGKITLIITHKN